MAAIEASLQPVAAVGIGIYVMAVLFGTKIPYDMMVNRGVEHIRAVYYNRKIVHMLAGGVGSCLSRSCFQPVVSSHLRWSVDGIHMGRAPFWKANVLVSDGHESE